MVVRASSTPRATGGGPNGTSSPGPEPHRQGDAIRDNVTLGKDNRERWTSAVGPCAYHYFLNMAAPYLQNRGTVEPAVGGPYPYAKGTGAEVTATANPGFSSVEWQELVEGNKWVSINGSATLDIKMDQDRTVRALFLPARYSLSVTMAPLGDGTVTVSPRPGAARKYAAGTTVTLTARPAGGFQFVRLEGAATGTSPTCQSVMDGDKSITAVFGRIPIFF